MPPDCCDNVVEQSMTSARPNFGEPQRLAFVACDHFHEDCVWVSEAVPATFLAELVKNRVLYSYAPA
jgi:hypothetical protein